MTSVGQNLHYLQIFVILFNFEQNEILFTILTKFKTFGRDARTEDLVRFHFFFPELVLTSSNFSALFQFDSETFWLFAPVYYIYIKSVI